MYTLKVGGQFRHSPEDVIYFELLRRGYKVYIGKVREKEIDFIAEKPDDKVYYQVTKTMLGDTVRERELAYANSWGQCAHF